MATKRVNKKISNRGEVNRILASDKPEDQEILARARYFFETTNRYESTFRSEAADDLKFSHGDQWEGQRQLSRTGEGRPALTINKLNVAVNQIVNNMRAQRPRMMAKGMNNETDEQLAEVVTGILRHIEINSDGESAYDCAADYQVRTGRGFFRVTHDYANPETFEQEIYIEEIANPFTVYWDPASIALDGSDAKECMITEFMDKVEYAKQYPDAAFTPYIDRATGDSDRLWLSDNQIRLAEYFWTEEKVDEVLQLSNGETMLKTEYDRRGLEFEIIGRRRTLRKTIKWAKINGFEVLETKEWVGKYIPVIPVIGNQVFIDGIKHIFGIVRNAKDVQRTVNYWTTSVAENIALAPKAKWITPAQNLEGFEGEWGSANISPRPVLRYKPSYDQNGALLPAPQQVPPVPIPPGIFGALEQANKDLAQVLGIYDVNQLAQGQQSGKALLGQQTQVDQNNFQYFDNMSKSIAHCGRVCLDLMPHIYDTQRTMRIVGADGIDALVTVNELDEITGRIANDLSIGEFNIVMDAGAGSNSKREQAIQVMLPLFEKDPQLMQTCGDLLFRSWDFPGALVIAERLAALNPLAQNNEKMKQWPREAQTMVKALQQQLQQAQGQLQQMGLEMKYRGDIASQKNETELKKELMKQTAFAHDVETRTEAKVHDVNTRATTAQNVAEINAIATLLVKHIDTAQLEKELAQRDKEQKVKMDTAVADIEDKANPLTQGQ